MLKPRDYLRLFVVDLIHMTVAIALATVFGMAIYSWLGLNHV